MELTQAASKLQYVVSEMAIFGGTVKLGNPGLYEAIAGNEIGLAAEAARRKRGRAIPLPRGHVEGGHWQIPD